MTSWTTTLASALGFKPSAHKIPVYPVSLAPKRQPIELWSAFYALGCLTAYAKVHHDGVLRDRFEFGRITPMSVTDIPALLRALPKTPGVFLLSSYVWNHRTNVEFARALKQRMPEGLVIIGGPHVPRAPKALEQFFAQHPYVDVAVRHEGEVTLAEILARLALDGVDPHDLARADLSAVEGLTFRRGDGLVRTPDRARTMDPAIFPSPYLTGEFDHWVRDRAHVAIETNRGCPYGCTFCDWGAATLSKLGRMTMERVLGEVEFAASHHIESLGICDANFGILPRDVEIARFIVEMKEKHGYPHEVGYTNAKTATPRLTEIIKMLCDAGLIAGGQISMQTTDEQILKNVERSNIKMSEYRKIIAFFHQENIPAVSDIMLGLPGQTFETCKKDLQFCFDHRVTAMIFATSVMPNAPMADEEYQRKFKIVVGDDGFVESTYSFTREEYARMFDLCLAYKFFIKLGVLKYFLYFLQLEHGVLAMDFLARWLQVTGEHPERYPISTRIRQDLVDRSRDAELKDWLSIAWADEQARFLFDEMDAFHGEVLALVEREFGLRLEGSDVEAVLAANREVMPKKGRGLPAHVRMPHDVAEYFSTLRKLPSLDARPEDHVPLRAHGPGTLKLPHQPETTTYNFVDLINIVGKLELQSSVRI
jgi:radical SAM superfamily enzyme YgiQ (UPF0313 family)